jgi:uncharacterized protein
VKMGYVQIDKGILDACDWVGNVGFFAIIIVFAIWVFWCFFKNLNVLKTEEVH